MNERPVTEADARQFLLGAVDESKRQQIQSLLVTDSEVKDTILIAEEELVEDYLEGNLTDSDKAKFLEQYTHSPLQRRRLRIAETIKTHAMDEARSSQAKRSPTQPTVGDASFSTRRRRFYVPIAVAATILLAITAFWAMKWDNLRIRENNQRLEVERALAELNTPARLAEKPSDMVSLTLPPVSLRSIDSRAEVATRDDLRIIELQLPWTQKEEAQTYTALLLRTGGTEQYTIPNLHHETTSGGRIIRIRLPANLLLRGQYHLRLTPLTTEATPTTAEQYDFVITKSANSIH
jgi:hypothetical protein